MRRQLALVATAVTAATVALSGCGGSSSSTSSGPTTTADGAATTAAAAASAGGAITGTITVFAASSLKDTFASLAASFETAHPGTKVVVSLGGSDTLAAQITAGAPVDVFAAASPKTMATVTAAKDGIGTPVDFAKNQLEIATEPGNPLKIASLADVTKPGTKLVICAAAVPCGAAATEAFAAAKLTPKPVSLEQDVKSVLTKIELKEADAGIVYETDVKAAGAKVTGVTFPESAQAISTYPIVQITTGKNPAGAKAFIAYVTSATGEGVLQAAGFLAP